MTTKEQDENLPDEITSEAAAGWIQSAMERLTRTSFGQAILKHLDKFLWIVEKSAEWSLPNEELYLSEDENGKPSVKLEFVRPLPWILFLPSLVILRSIRVGLNIGAFILGAPRIEPITVVKFMQRNRKYVRDLRSRDRLSWRTKFKRKDKRLSMNEAKQALIRSIRLTLSTLSCLDGSKPSLSPPPTRIQVSALDLDAAITPGEKSATESAESPKHKRTKRVDQENRATVASSVDSDDDTGDETLQQKIDRLVLDDTEDPDFVPPASNNSSNDDDDDDGENDDNNDDDDEDDLDVPQEELIELTEDARSLLDGETKEASVEIKQKRDQETSKEEYDKTESDMTGMSVDSRDFHTPCQFSQDGDAPFYSPISSNSSGSDTPDRSASPSAIVQNSHPTDILKTNEFGNGEARFASGSTVSGRSLEEINNGAVVEKRNANPNKSHHRGKRTSYGSRKRK